MSETVFPVGAVPTPAPGPITRYRGRCVALFAVIVLALPSNVAAGRDGTTGSTAALSRLSPPVVASVLVDTNRDGRVGAGDEQGKDTITQERGALAIVNYDQSAGHPDAIGFDSHGKPADENFVLEAGDESDLARIVVEHVPTADLAARGARLLLSASAEDVKAFHLFAKIRAGARSIWGGLKETRTSVDITPQLTDDGSGRLRTTTFGLEALFLRDLTAGAYAGTFPKGFNGTIHLTLSEKRPGAAPVRLDQVALRVAPFMLLPNTLPANEVWVAASPLAAQLQRALATAPGGAPVRFSFADSQWTQDEAEIGYTQAPGTPKELLSLALVHLKKIAMWPTQLFSGPGRGWFTFGKDIGEGHGNYGGNIEVMPPTRGFPLGRIVVGDTISKRLFGFLRDQQVQDPVEIDTSWLRVGHVDETIEFLPRPGGKFAIGVASPDIAVCLLGGTAAAPGKDLSGRPCATGIPPAPDTSVFFATGPTEAGTASGGGVNTLADAGRDFESRPWTYVRIYAGPGAGQIAHISKRLRGSIAVDQVWNTGSNIVAGPGSDPKPGAIGKKWFTKPTAASRFVLLEGTKMWRAPGSSPKKSVSFPAATTVYEIRRDTGFWHLNTEAQQRLDEIVQTLEKAGGKHIAVVRLPTIYMGDLTATGRLRAHGTLAFTPGLANFQPLGRSVLFADPFAPVEGKGDLFEEAVKIAVPDARFVDDWNLYHALGGEVHCGTYVVRKPFALDWWSHQP